MNHFCCVLPLMTKKNVKEKTLCLKLTRIVVLYIITPNHCISVWWLSRCLSNPSIVWPHYLELPAISNSLFVTTLHKLQRQKISVLIEGLQFLESQHWGSKTQLNPSVLHLVLFYYLLNYLRFLFLQWCLLYSFSWSTTSAWLVQLTCLRCSTVCLKISPMKGCSVFFQDYTTN